MTTTTKLVAERIADELLEQGCDAVFGYPGEGTIELIRAFSMTGITFVLAHSETGAAFMAAAHAEVTGRTGMVVTTLGPGVTNAVTGAAYAKLDRAPLLVVTDRFTAAQANSSGRQLLDHQGVLRPVVKASEVVTADGAGREFARALRLAADPPCGPVHLDLPRDVSAGASAESPERAAGPQGEAPRHGLPGPDPAVLEAIAKELAGASRPILVVGLEANRSVVQDDLVRLARRLRCPVLTTYKAKGLFPEHDPQWAGLYSGSTAERSILSEADVLLGVGLDSVESQPVPWPYAMRVLALNESAETSAYYRPETVAVGDVGTAVRTLAEGSAEAASAWPQARLQGHGAGLVDGLRLEPPAGGLAAWQVVEGVRRVAERRRQALTVTVDAGSHRLATSWFWRANEPHRFFTTNGLGTMGYAVPAAIGAAVARPGQAALAFTGDGGFMLHGYELETAARLGAKVVVVVFNDSSLSQIRIKQARRSYARSGVDFTSVRYDEIGRGLGVRGLRVDAPGELEAVVDEALEGPRSCVIDVVLTGGEYGQMLDRLRGRKP